MKLGEYVGLILFVGLVFVCWNLLIDDFETTYVDTGISNVSKVSSNYTDKFDYSEDINNSLGPVSKKFGELGESSNNWFTDLLEYGTAIPLVVVNFAKTMIGIFITTGSGIAEFLELIGLPKELIMIAGISLIAFAVFKFIELIHK